MHSSSRFFVDNLKKFLSSPLILVTPVSKEDLYLYLDISGNDVSSVLSRANGRQH